MDNSEIKLTAPRRYADYELLTEIFGFVPTVVLDDLFNLTNVLFYKFMEGTADKIIAARPDKLREINMVVLFLNTRTHNSNALLTGFG